MTNDANLVVFLLLGIYLGLAVAGLKVLWRRTAELSARRRMVLRTLAVAVLFAPAVAGARVVPFLLAATGLLILDVLFVRPLTLAWATKTLAYFGLNMLLPLLLTWSVLLAAVFIWQHVRRTK